MKPIYLVFILFCFRSHSFGQTSKLVYREKITQGNYLMLENNYVRALRSFKEAYLIDSTSANINYKLGLCYLQSSTEKNKAVYHLEKAVKHVIRNYSPEDVTEKKAPIFAYYSLGIAYRLNYNFTASNLYFNKLKDLVGKRNNALASDIEKQLIINTNAEVYARDTANVKISNLSDTINSQFPDYYPVISADESTLIFTSRRNGGTGEEKTDDDQFLEDIYVSYKKNDGSYTAAKSIGVNINTILNEASVGLAPDGIQLFVYKDINGGDIYYSKLIGDSWSSLTPFSASINSPFTENHASISLDGNTLYFVSNRKVGGFGGRDIWSSVKSPTGEWSLPTNLGPTINTAADEDAPFIHSDGVTLFFSSNGHKSMGGFDVFKTTKTSDGKWSEPENLRAPINTTDDDLFYVQSVDGKHGYLSSSRIGSVKDKDIYRIDFEQSITKPLVLLRGVLKFDSINTQTSNARITVIDSVNKELVQVINPNELTGKYSMILNPGSTGKTYNISLEAEGFKSAKISLVIPPNSSYQEIEKEFLLQMLTLENSTFGKIEIKSLQDKDGDSVLDLDDLCPDISGIVENKGCPWPDTDKDGVLDKDDNCPTIAGLKELKGCTWLDTDNDGVLDKDDNCPTTPGLKELKGCNWPDTDKDGVLDKDDKCPTIAGIAELKGCTWPDSDKDGVPDKSDNCPTSAGLVELQGCPPIPEMKLEELEILQTAFSSLEFATGKDVIKASSLPSLNELAVLMKEHASDWILKLSGHTDNQGDAEKNMLLSEKRVKAIKKYLINKGVKQNMIILEWFGQTTPIADNTTEIGRQKNRRVEMKIDFKR
jgi:outer membrane protein OmpA-like peptidoglycan-associated protein